MVRFSTAAIFRLAEAVKGFLSPQEGRCLYEIGCQAAPMGPFLEIGSYCGKSTIFLGAACKKNGVSLFTVDLHRGSEEQQPGELYFDAELFDPFYFRIDTFKHFRQNIEKTELEKTVIPIVASSETTARHWTTPLSLVFIDGGHSYDAVLKDYFLWHRHILPNGYLIFHDVFPDPADGGQAPYQVYQTALSSGLFKAHPMTGSLGILQRQDCKAHIEAAVSSYDEIASRL